MQRAIQNRRRPYANLAKYMVDDARLTHIQLTYNMAEELQLVRPGLEEVSGQLKHSSCESILLLYVLTNVAYKMDFVSFCHHAAEDSLKQHY